MKTHFRCGIPSASILALQKNQASCISN